MKSLLPLFAAFSGGLILASVTDYFFFARPDSMTAPRESIVATSDARPARSSSSQAPALATQGSPRRSETVTSFSSQASTTVPQSATRASKPSAGFVSTEKKSSAPSSRALPSSAPSQTGQTSSSAGIQPAIFSVAPQTQSPSFANTSLPSGGTSSAAAPVGATEAVNLPTGGVAPEVQAELPASLVPNSPDVPITTDQQVAEWEQLQDDFIEQVGEGAPEPQNEASRARWTSAQEYNDWLFRAKFGTYAYLAQKAAGIEEPPAN